jgi:hypothetical protein
MVTDEGFHGSDVGLESVSERELLSLLFSGEKGQKKRGSFEEFSSTLGPGAVNCPFSFQITNKMPNCCAVLNCFLHVPIACSISVEWSD